MIEEFLRGEEVSFIVVAAGEQVVPLATSQDHKRRDDGDHGPNTGGMGAYSPAPIVTPDLHARIMREVIEPDAARPALSTELPITGFLYAGLMIARGRYTQRARVQLPARRPGDPADSHAPAKRSRDAVRGGSSRIARSGSK